MDGDQGSVRRFEGYVYVVLFASGVVKVGRSGNPKRRLSRYTRDGLIHSNPVADSWVSPPHGDSWANEARLIRFCEERGSLAAGGKRGEYFVGVEFESVCTFAATLSFHRVDVERAASEMAGQMEPVLAAWSQFIGLDRVLRLPPSLAAPAGLTAWFERLGGESASERLSQELAALFEVSPDELRSTSSEVQKKITRRVTEQMNLLQEVECLEQWLQAARTAYEECMTQGFEEIRDEIQAEAEEAWWRKAEST